MAKLFIPEIFGVEVLRAYKANSVLSALGKKRCDVCKKLLAYDRFFTKTTCRACYTGARR